MRQYKTRRGNIRLDEKIKDQMSPYKTRLNNIRLDETL